MIHHSAGLYIALDLNGGRATRNFLNDIPPHIGVPVEADQLHISAMYPEELAEAGLGVHERVKLPGVANKVMSDLADIGLIGQRLRTVPNVLKPFKKGYGIEFVDEAGLCNEVRSIGASAVKEALGIQLRTWLDGHHATVAWRARSNGRRADITYRRHFPRELFVSGVTVKVDDVAFEADGRPHNYINCFQRTKLSA